MAEQAYPDSWEQLARQLADANRQLEHDLELSHKVLRCSNNTTAETPAPSS